MHQGVDVGAAEQVFGTVGEAGTGAEAVHLAAQLLPDVVLMDVRMPRMDGIEATRVIHDATPGSRIIVLTMFNLDEYVYAALRAGASGFLCPWPVARSIHLRPDAVSGRSCLPKLCWRLGCPPGSEVG